MRKDFLLIIVLSLTPSCLKPAIARKDLRAFVKTSSISNMKVSIAILYEL